MSLAFRNVEVPDRVQDWPYEAVVTAIERGTIGDWALLTRAIAVDPWGELARQVEDYLGYADDASVAALLRRRIEHARAEVAARDREQVAARIREST